VCTYHFSFVVVDRYSYLIALEWSLQQQNYKTKKTLLMTEFHFDHFY